MTGSLEFTLRLSIFAGVLVVMSIWEWLAPCRPLTVRKVPRWACHLGLVALNTLLVRLLIPITAVGAALVVEAHQWGLLQFVDGPTWLEITLAVLAFDLAIYLQHVLFHAIPVLWRLHMVHHADLDFDVTTGLRFHGLEILLSALFKLAVVVIVGPSAVAVMGFEVLLNASAMFNHSNVRLPLWLDRKLRLIVVTPDMHRVHHSIEARETNSNFGFNLPWWDRLLGTYRDQPEAGHTAMQIGLRDWRDEHDTERLQSILYLPFRSPPKEPRQGKQ